MSATPAGGGSWIGRRFPISAASAVYRRKVLRGAQAISFVFNNLRKFFDDSAAIGLCLPLPRKETNFSF
jgi:hypothetical protein